MKNPRINFFPENKKSGEKFPGLFSSCKQCRKKPKILKITKSRRKRRKNTVQ
jgi:hypothetical protein